MPAALRSPAVLPILMLVASNVFMTIAWYGHLKFPHAAMGVVVMVSWGIALVEYWLAVPANRIGYGTYTAAELKTIQEVISLTVFTGFAVLDRKSTRLNSSHVKISYAVFCLKKKNIKKTTMTL